MSREVLLTHVSDSLESEQDRQMRLQRASRLREIVEYALALGNARSGKFSQRDLAVSLNLAPTMVTRYLTGNVDVLGLKFSTIELLASACELTETTLFTWIRSGRSDAMNVEERFHQGLMSHQPIDLARRLLDSLECVHGPIQRHEDPEVPGVVIDYEGLLAQIEAIRERNSERRFRALLEACAAEPAAQKVEAKAGLDPQDWEALGLLLDREDLEEAYIH